ncbi:MAG: hypothetical protein A3G32_07585 [Deltaproteobacteria bacterium RIFCSPLOWO2_12_FULL_40_28]|nr:MAG: hypothetical protein A3C45_03375 [Deltaproteobacteria bacterium RIFCSPHIGHO2_02_FULL_40_28]OGQ20278.1 MAG: hypothetical protein A3E27_06480 [Deltaproteobacteria bacterium RIFCSPHIGHO2_12_FULL_40_32]OGQ40389.1 MAG: hypothetical protein A3I69_06990 [Deltaproteobacteria bacterium RIFCSPLOWO2_02_FULL_40_36]OGQ54858.1 MAG: hypothetical protein A3G32_07585 [Deltaproteobacteria bacterium RIFCSPLOWO2_12_FULL_40_28]
MSHKNGDFSKISDILASSLDVLKPDQNYSAYALTKNWANLVGHQISQKSFPLFIRNKILVVEVVNGAWLNELSLQRKEILEKIQKSAGLEIKDIRLTLKRPD